MRAMQGDSGTMTRGTSDGLKRLAEFIAAASSQAEFAKQVGCSEPHLSLVLSGARGLSLKLAKRISEATGGAVSMEALVK